MSAQADFQNAERGSFLFDAGALTVQSEPADDIALVKLRNGGYLHHVEPSITVAADFHPHGDNM